MSESNQDSWFWSRLNRSERQQHPFKWNCSRKSFLSREPSDGEVLEDNEVLLKKDMIPARHSLDGRYSRISSSCLIVLATLISIICSTAFILIISQSLAKQISSQTEIKSVDLTAPFRPIPRLRHCGTHAEEARSLGCKFQIWSYSWVPPECYDGELVQDWLDIRDWEYFDDRYDRGKVVNFTTEVLSGARLLYSTWGQHYWHCAFTWRKFLRAALGSGVGITDQDLDYHHANHCQETIRNKPDFRPWDENDIELTVGFHSC